MIGKSPDVGFGIWFSIWNVGYMSGKLCEISETLKRHGINICWQEVRWKVQGIRMIGNGSKFLWSGGCKAENHVGVILPTGKLGRLWELIGVMM